MRQRSVIIAYLAWLLGGASVASAQAPHVIKSTVADLDQDGTPDRVQLLASGTVVIESHAGRLNVSSGGRADSGTIEVNDGLVIITKIGISGTWVVAVDAAAAPITTIFEGPVGSQENGAWFREVRRRGSTIEIFERHPNTVRCDHLEPTLFHRAWDRKTRKLRRVAIRFPKPRPAATLVAKFTTSMPKAYAFRAAAASSSLGTRNAGELTPPVALTDSDPNTAWIEGRAGHGIGEFVTLRSRRSRKLHGLTILSGHSASAAEYNRLRSFMIVTPTVSYKVNVPMDPVRSGILRPVHVALPSPITTRCVSIVIGDVYPGRSPRFTAISEITAVTDLELSGDIDHELVQELSSTGSPTAAEALADRGTQAIPELLKALGSLRGNAREHIIGVLATIGAPATLPQLAESLGYSDVSDEAKSRVRRALVKAGTSGALALGSVLRSTSASDASRNAAARVLSTHPDTTASAELWTALGAGTLRARRGVTSALARRYHDDGIAFSSRAVAELGSDLSPNREADLWWVTALIGPDSGELARSVAQRLRGVASYELMHRRLQAASSLASEVAVAAVAATLASLRNAPSPTSTALRRVAVEFLLRNRHAHARAVVTRALGDPDPGVRIRAASAAGHPVHDVGELLRGDPWPQVRRAAAETLGTTCSSDPSHALLVRAVESDPDPNVRGQGVTSIARCRGPEAVPWLAKIALNRRQPPGVRILAVQAIAAAGGRGASSALIRTFRRARSQAYTSSGERQVAVAAASGLGKFSNLRTERALIDATREEAFPDIQAAAITALSGSCPKALRQRLPALITVSDQRVRTAARRARAKCRNQRAPGTL